MNLAELYTYPQVIEYTKAILNINTHNADNKNLTTKPDISHDQFSSNFIVPVIPHLFPFFEHSMSNVRQSAIQLCLRLFMLFEQETLSSFSSVVISQLLQHLFQRILLEPHEVSSQSQQNSPRISFFSSFFQVASLFLHSFSFGFVLEYCK